VVPQDVCFDLPPIGPGDLIFHVPRNNTCGIGYRRRANLDVALLNDLDGSLNCSRHVELRHDDREPPAGECRHGHLVLNLGQARL
jgi:hypothetical protein